MDSGIASIIIGNYNYGRFLGSAIESALSQTYPRTEVIVVDDGSTDDSRSVIADFAEHIHAVLRANGGQAAAFNDGLAVSRGTTILFMDSDDVLAPTAIQRAVEVFRDPAVVKVHWPLWEIDEAGRRTGHVKPSSPLAEGDVRSEVIRYGQTRASNSSTTGSAWRRWFLEQVVPIRECGDKHGADAYLATLAPIFGTLGIISEPQGFYRLHAANFSAGMTVRARLERDRRRYDFLCRVLGEFLLKQGSIVDPMTWKGPDTYFAWLEEMLQVSDQLGALIPGGSSFILVDDNQLGSDFVVDRRGLPFLEHEGRFAGFPSDDPSAIAELERTRQSGASHLAFVRATHWWLDCYAGFHQYLRSHFACVFESEQLLLFDLRIER
jgi:glycosyltransferase involved in cell wall biosynthesis